MSYVNLTYMHSLVWGEDFPLDIIAIAITTHKERKKDLLKNTISHLFIKNIGSITDLSLYDILFKIFCLI